MKIAKSNVIAQAHAEYVKAMSRGMVLYKTQSPVAEIAERLLYAREQLNFIIEEMQIQGLSRPPQGIPSIESMEARLEALETLALVAR